MADQNAIDLSVSPERVPGRFTLEHDIVVADKVVHPAGTEIRVAKPMGGALRGVNLGGLVRMDYDQVAAVAPRTTQPILHKHLVEALDPADLMQLAGEYVDFLLPTAAKEALFPSG